MAESGKQRTTAAKETMEVLMEMSKILNTNLDMETLTTVVRLCESGINPDSLALAFNELRKEAAAIKEGNEKARAKAEQMALRGMASVNESSNQSGS